MKKRQKLELRIALCLALLFVCSSMAHAQAGGQTLYNGITLPQQWPPSQDPTQAYQVPYYITNPPSVIKIDTGRQLFVDDFLIQQSTLARTGHQPVMYPGNPIVVPDQLDTANLAMPFSDGVWFDPSDNLFKMFFYCGQGGLLYTYLCYEYSTDGKTWTRHSIPGALIPNSDEVLQCGCVTVWMDLQDPNPARKFKAFNFVPSSTDLQLFFSPDGINWTGTYVSQYPVPLLADRTTVFWNPFRNVWVDSLKNYLYLPSTPSRPSYQSRIRYYAESPDLMTWPTDLSNAFWTGPDVNDPTYVTGGAYPQLYNLDAVAYESVMVGLFNWFHPGPGDDDPNNLPGPDIVELGVGFSRDGFSWVRPTRGSGPTGAFIAASNTPGTWNMGNTQSAGGGFLVVGDELWFYFSGRSGQHADPNVVGATGLATLRRDGFYSMDAGSTAGTLVTHPVQFSGKYLFVNVNDPQGSLQIQVLNPSNGAVLATSLPLSVDKTLQQVSWNGITDLSSFADQPVEFQFTLTNGELYSFWVSASTSGASNGYVAAGGPGFTGVTDNLGSAAYPSTAATPEISPAGGTISGSTNVTIFTGTPGATIYYTLDGTNPTTSSNVYNGPFQLSASATVNAIAAASGLSNSAIATTAFTLDNTPPQVTITAPQNGQAVSAGITLAANASDGVGVASVQFLMDGVPVGTVISPPYTLTFETETLSNSSHQITAVVSDEVGNTAVSAPVTVTVNNVAAGPTSGLVGYWSFDPAYVSGSIIFDQSGNNGDATANSTTSVPGVSGQALQFNGNSSYTQVASSLSTQLYDLMGDLSLSLWVQTTNSSRDEALISKYSAGSTASGYLLRTTPGGTAELLLGTSNVGTGAGVATDVTRINDGNWHHLAVVIKLGSSVTFYVDGALSSTATIYSVAGPAASWLQMGVNPYTAYGNYFTGGMDEVRIYNRALSSSEVAALADYLIIKPSSVTLNQGQTQQFTAALGGIAAPVSWSINPAIGTISPAGLYTVPNAITNGQTITVTATSAVNGVNPGTAIIQLGVPPAAQYSATDVTTSGNWQGVYGADGYAIAPNLFNIPSYASFSVQNQFNYTWIANTTDPRALQVPGGSGGTAATWYNSPSFSFDINTADSNSHRVALYLLDWDNKGRSETIQILNAATGAVLDSRSISNFSAGTYVVWNITGHVSVIITATQGPNAVVSGVFFGGGSSVTVAATSGTPQNVPINTAFSQLSTTVTSSGNPVPNVTVTFAAPPNGASGTFAGSSTTATATTNTQGTATAPIFSSNNSTGSYTVTATIAGAATTANFSLTNGPGAAQSIAATSGSGQTAQITNTFPNVLVATVTDLGGNPVPGVTVTFTVPASGPSASFSGAAAATGVTNALGQAASPALQANTIAGGPYAVTATVLGATTTADFLLVNDAGPPHNILTTNGSGQLMPINATFNPLVATVTDVDGNPVSGVVVTFTAPASGASGTFSGSATATAVSNASGQVTSPAFTANGTFGGPYVVAASFPGAAASANFALTNNGPHNIAAANGGGQIALQNTAFANPLVTTVTDFIGNPVSGVSVTFTAPTSGSTGAFGTSATATVSTNALGQASSPAFTANGTLGAYTVTASVSGVAAIANFSLTNNGPHSIAAASGGGQTTLINAAFSSPLVATVTDLFGNPLPGFTVTFSAPSSGPSGLFASSAAATAITNASGQASAPLLVANSVLGGPYLVTASVSGVATNASFSLTNNGPHAIVAASGSGQTALVNATFPNPLVATVTDLFGNPLPGFTVTFSAPSSGPSGSFGSSATATAITNASGQASAPLLVANGILGGPYAVTASVSSVATNATFSLTNDGPHSITSLSGSGQITNVNTSFPSALVATVLGLTGNPIAGVTVTFAAPSSGPSGLFVGSSSATAITDSSGHATSPTFTANSTTGGPYSVTASVSGVATNATFSLTNDGPHSITALSGSGQTTSVDTPFPNALVATVLDLVGNPIGGVTVTFAAPSSGPSGSFAGSTSATATTDASGHATSPSFTANGTPGGPYSVTASVSGVATNAGFSLTNTQPAGQITVTTNTNGPTVTVDNGTPFTGSQTFTWAIGSNHTLTTTTPQSVSGVQYTFTGWSDGGAQSHTVTTPATAATYTAIFSVTRAVFVPPTDSSTKGNWQGKYGTDGYDLANLTPASIPSYATFAVQNALSYTWASGTSDSRALQIPGGSGGIAAAWYSGALYSFTLSFNDGATHQFALYAVDWDGKGRSEQIQIVDANTNNQLDSETLTNFGNGTYLVWNISGSVKINVTTLAGPNAVVNGVFFSSGTSGGTETVTVNPATVSLSGGGSQQFTATVANGTGQPVWTISAVNPSGAAQGSLSTTTPGLYTAPATVTTAATVTIKATSADGTASGTATVKLTPATGGGSSATFLPPQDITTEGSWQGVYGADGYDLANVTPASIPSYATFAVQNALSYTWASGTSDSRALQIPGGSGGIAAAWYSGALYSFTLSFNDGATHQFALYAVDWDGKGRSEQIQIVDANTNNQLDSETISNFSGGVYLAWNISGSVKINVTTLAGPNAVVNGVFFSSGTSGGTETVTVSPATVSLSGGGSQQFTATVANGTGQPVWTISAVNPSGAAQGTLSTTTPGLYTAPATVTTAATVTIKATSADGTAFGTATVNLAPETVTLSPASVSLAGGASKQFSATVANGTGSPIWTISAVSPTGAAQGSLSTTTAGLYTAPATVTTATTVTIKATSADGTAFGTATVNLTPATGGGSSATFLPPQDITTKGSWQGVYGADGYDLANVTPASVPSYATFAVQNAFTWTWASPTSDARALQNPSGSGGIAATWYSNAPFSFTLNFTDGATHQFSIYAVDWDSEGRSETIQIVDASTNNQLDSETISNFSGGVYLAWNISGNVKINVTPTGNGNAVVSGVFFGGTTSSAETVTVSPASVSLSGGGSQQFTATVANGTGQPVWTISAVNPSGAAQGTLSTTTPGLYTAPATVTTAATVTIKATSADGTAFGTATVNLAPETVTLSPASVSLAGGASKQFSATVVNGTGSPVWAISAVSPTGAAQGSLSTTTAGLYTAPATVTVATTVTIKATSADGTAFGTATVNLTPATGGGSSATFLPPQDITTKGSWQGKYGSDGYDLEGVTPDLPSYATFAMQNSLTYTWASPTTDARALQNPSASGGIAATWYSNAPFNFMLNFTDGATHQFSIYAVDWDSEGRSETIQIVDASTNNQLDSETISNFSGGVYLAWNISGNVKINVTPTGTGNAVVSGVFFGGTTSSAETVTVSPASVSLSGGGSQQFSATVANGTGQPVWTISAVNPSGAAQGTLSTTTPGLYTAPATVTTAATVTIKATSADGTAFGTATVNLAPETVTVSPASVSLAGGASKQFSATVANGTGSPVWTISAVSPTGAAQGSLSTTTPGLYTAPATVTVATTVTIKATSADGTAFGTATVNLTPATGGGSSATFLPPADTTTKGSWQGKYGANGYQLANVGPASIPTYATFAVQNSLSWTWASPTSDARALQNPSGSGGIAATWYNPGTFSFTLNFTDGATHQFALYAVDWDNLGRSETIQIVDASTNNQLDSETISNFSGGVYLAWNISGNVKINVTTQTSNNAVISGAFFK